MYTEFWQEGAEALKQYICICNFCRLLQPALLQLLNNYTKLSDIKRKLYMGDLSFGTKNPEEFLLLFITTHLKLKNFRKGCKEETQLTKDVTDFYQLLDWK